MRPKITVVGAGATGGSTARRIAARGYADVVLVDIIADFAAGKALDLNQAGSLVGYPPTIIGTGSYDATVGSSVCVITSGFPRKPGMSRDDLLAVNSKIVGGVTPGKGKQEHLGVPVFDTVREAKRETGADVSVIFVPAPYAAEAIVAAVDAKIELIVCITEGIPVQDMINVKSKIKKS